MGVEMWHSVDTYPALGLRPVSVQCFKLFYTKWDLSVVGIMLQACWAFSTATMLARATLTILSVPVAHGDGTALPVSGGVARKANILRRSADLSGHTCICVDGPRERNLGVKKLGVYLMGQ